MSGQLNYFLAWTLFIGTSWVAFPACSQVVQEYHYEPDRIYQVRTGLGITTQIELSPSEKIVDFSTGFSGGWDLTRRENVFYLKPKNVDVDTNMMIEAVLAFQQANGLKADGIVGAHTLDALKKAEQAPLLSNPAHPDYFLYKQALAGVGKLPFSTFKDEQERQNAAASLAVDAKVSGLKQINHVLVSTHGLGLFAVQGRIDDPAHDRVHVDKAQAATQPIERSTQQMDDERRNQQSQQQSRIENETRRMTV